MNARGLSRRLDRLEQHILPLDQPKVWEVVQVDSNGTRTPTGIMIEMPPPRAPIGYWYGPPQKPNSGTHHRETFVSSQLHRPSPYWASAGRLRRERDSRRTFAFSMGQNKGGD